MKVVERPSESTSVKNEVGVQKNVRKSNAGEGDGIQSKRHLSKIFLYLYFSNLIFPLSISCGSNNISKRINRKYTQKAICTSVIAI